MPDYNPAHTRNVVSLCCLHLGTKSSCRKFDFPGEDGWIGIQAAALDHGLIGPLQSVVSQFDGVPAEVRLWLRPAALVQLVQNLHLMQALLELSAALRRAGVESAVLKGPAIALLVSGLVGPREFTDLDVLIRFGDLRMARLVLRDLGYVEQGDVPSHERRLRGQKDLAFFRKIDGVLVELHWALNPPTSRFPLEATGIFSRLQSLPFQQGHLRTLSLEDTLIALCIHGSVHGWSSLKWVFDIAQILHFKAGIMNWTAVLERAASARSKRAVLVGIRLSHLIFEICIPDPIKVELRRDPRAVIQSDRFRDALINNKRLTGVDLIASRIQIHDRLRDRVAITLRVIARRLARCGTQSLSPDPIRVTADVLRLIKTYRLEWLRNAVVGR